MSTRSYDDFWKYVNARRETYRSTAQEAYNPANLGRKFQDGSEVRLTVHSSNQLLRTSSHSAIPSLHRNTCALPGDTVALFYHCCCCCCLTHLCCSCYSFALLYWYVCAVRV